MSGNVNKVMLLGRLTRNPDLKCPGDTALATFGIAVNRKYKTKAGEQREDVTFIDCEAWGRTAEVIGQHLHKGSPIFVEGRLRFSQWDDHGTNRSKLTVTVEHFEFVGEREKAQA